MNRVFCKDKKGFCDCIEDCRKCGFAKGNGVIDGGVAHDLLATIFGADYDLDRLRELVQADRDGRCVLLPCGEGARINRDGIEYVADHWNITLTAFAKDDTAKSGEKLGIFGVEDAEQALKEVEKDG